MKIIITGSLGRISKPLTQELVQKGHAVTVISSNPDKEAAIEALGAKAAIGSIADVEFLTETFTGADAVYCMIPPDFSELDQVAYYRKTAGNYVKAITASDIQRVVHLSSYGAHLDKGTGFILGAHHAEVIFNELPGIALTHLRPGYFYYNLYNFIGMIKAAGFIGTNYGGDDKIPMVAPADIAAAAAEELVSIPDGNNIHYIASDDIAANDAAAILGAAIGKPGLKWLTISSEQMRQGMEQHGMQKEIVALFVELGEATHTGLLREDYDLHKPTVMGNIKLTDFAKEFAAAYNQK